MDKINTKGLKKLVSAVEKLVKAVNEIEEAEGGTETLLEAIVKKGEE